LFQNKASKENEKKNVNIIFMEETEPVLPSKLSSPPVREKSKERNQIQQPPSPRKSLLEEEAEDLESIIKKRQNLLMQLGQAKKNIQDFNYRPTKLSPSSSPVNVLTLTLV
jgi:hypothetical protein